MNGYCCFIIGFETVFQEILKDKLIRKHFLCLISEARERKDPIVTT